MRSLRITAALLCAAFALTGCMKIDLKLTVDGKRDVLTGSMVFAMDKAVLTMGGKTPEESFKSSADTIKTLPKGTRSEVFDDGKFYGRKVIFENVAFQDFNGAAGSPTFVHKDGKYTFTMDADMSGAALGENAGMAKPFLDTIEVKVAITFPGKVIERDNLAELSGENTVTWSLKMGSAHKLKAVSEEPATMRWLLLAGVVGLFGLLAVLGIVVLAIRLRKRPAVEPDLGATLPPSD